MKCPRCNSNDYCKFGWKGEGAHCRQRFKCAQCGYNYTVSRLSKPGDRSWAYPLKMRQKAIRLFDDPKPRTYQQIAKLVGGGVTKSTIHKWITEHQFVQRLGKQGPVSIEKPAPSTEDDAG